MERWTPCFNPLNRGGDIQTYCIPGRAWYQCESSFNPLNRGGDIQTVGEHDRCFDVPGFNPLNRGGDIQTGYRHSGRAGWFEFQSS